jgi:signal transduction histidine kinase
MLPVRSPPTARSREEGRMRLALKIFLAQSLVVLVLVGVAMWSLVEVAKLSVADRKITVRVAEALRLEASLQEAVIRTSRLEMRNLVFADKEYAAVASAETGRIEQNLGRLREILSTDEEQGRLREVAKEFGEYQAAVAEARQLLDAGDRKRAEEALSGKALPIADRMATALDDLAELTRTGLDWTQAEARTALGQAQAEVARLRSRTWMAVTTAMIVGGLVALVGTAVVSVQMTRSLGRLSEATKAVAEGAFREPLPVESKDEIGRLAASFNAMAARLQELDETKARFYATVSHELRSPITSVREAARLLHGKGSDPISLKQERLVTIIVKSAERLLHLVGEVLDLSRADAGLLPLERRWVDLAPALIRAVEELRPQAEQRGIKLELDTGAGPGRVFGDEERLLQVVVNLVGNALRFTPAGGTVTVRLVEGPAETRVHVDDTGIGIRADLLPTIFDRFRQAHSGRGGAGLGLALVRAMVEAHGGRVSVESEEGKGSRFTVSLPRTAEGSAPAATEGRPAGGAPLASRGLESSAPPSEGTPVSRMLAVALAALGLLVGCQGALRSPGTAASALLARADAELAAANYREALDLYDRFLKERPADPAATRARASRGALDRLLAAESQIERLEREAAGRDAELQRLQRDVAARDAELARLRRDLTARQTEVERLKADLERLRSVDIKAAPKP